MKEGKKDMEKEMIESDFLCKLTGKNTHRTINHYI
jgi:hypothetical protein